jgi:PAS domain S-box-containing protein
MTGVDGSLEPEESVLDRVADAIFAVDDEWRVTYVNDRATELLDSDRDDLLGRSLWTAFPEARGTTFHRKYQQAMATQEPVSFTEYYGPLDRWFRVRAYPSETGLTVSFVPIGDDAVETQTGAGPEHRRLLRAVSRVQRDLAELGATAEDVATAERRLCERLDRIEAVRGVRLDGYDVERGTATTRVRVGQIDGIDGPAADGLREAARRRESVVDEFDDGTGSCVYVPLGRDTRLHGVVTLRLDGGVLVQTDTELLDGLGETAARALGEVDRRARSRSFQAISDAVGVATYVVDAEGTVRAANDGFERFLGIGASEVVGTPHERLVTERFRAVFESGCSLTERLLGTSDDGSLRRARMRITAGRGRAERVVEHARHPVETGAYAGGTAHVFTEVTVTDDATARTGPRGWLWQTVLEEFPGLVYRCRTDQGWPMEFVGGRPESMTGYDADSLENDVSWGSHVVLADDREQMRADIETQLTDGERFEVDYRIRHRNGSVRRVWERGRRIETPNGPRLTGFVVDVTDRHEAETKLREQKERVKSLLDHLSEAAIFRLDETGAVDTWNAGAERLLGYDESGAVGRSLSWFAATDRQRAPDVESGLVTAALEGEETVRGWWRRADDDPLFARVGISALTDDDGELRGYAVVVQDMTERRDRMRRLERQHALTERILDATPTGILVVDADETVEMANALAAEYVGTDRESLVGSNLSDHDWDVETRDGDPIPTEERAWKRVLEGESSAESVERQVSPEGEGRWLSIRAVPLDHDEDAVRRVVLAATEITSEVEQGRQIAAQRDELRTLDRINRVVRDIDRQLVRAERKEEIREAVTSRLTADERYALAWIGELDRGRETVSVTAADGTARDLLDEHDPVEAARDHPAVAAARDRTTTVVQRIEEDERMATERAAALDRGLRACAAVPIGYGDMRHGVLVVYSTEAAAFDAREREVLAELGEMVGYAFSAVDRKRALAEDAAMRVRFEIPELTERFGEVVGDDGEFTVSRSIERSDGQFLQYLETDGVDTERFVDQLTGLEFVASVEVVSEGETSATLAVETDRASVSRVVADYGGEVQEAVMAGGRFELTAEFSTGTELRPLVEAIRETYPRVGVVARETVTESWDGSPAGPDVREALTDRQLEVLELAYRSGYYEWPRETSGQELADLLDISPATLSQHLRAVHEKIADELLD